MKERKRHLGRRCYDFTIEASSPEDWTLWCGSCHCFVPYALRWRSAKGGGRNVFEDQRKWEIMWSDWCRLDRTRNVLLPRNSEIGIPLGLNLMNLIFDLIWFDLFFHGMSLVICVDDIINNASISISLSRDNSFLCSKIPSSSPLWFIHLNIVTHSESNPAFSPIKEHQHQSSKQKKTPHTTST